MTLYTREYCVEMINKCNEAEIALLTGKRYRIGSRELERADLSEIQNIRLRWQRELELIENNGKLRRRGKRVIPRDL